MQPNKFVNAGGRGKVSVNNRNRSFNNTMIYQNYIAKNGGHSHANSPRY